ncbi:DUF2254 family protein [Streptomyces subrutilus]|uniref:DUF2254 family protein n=1 Tax=Streptomyces subrutilus TaxID=36818 RepID=UPI0033E09BF4
MGEPSEPHGPRVRRRSRAPLGLPGRALRRDLSQLVCAVAGLLLGLLTPLVEAGPQVASDRVVGMLFTIGFGVISLASIIYSMLFLVVQFSASTFTPRLGLFRDEPIVWRAFAFTVGVFVFCITSALAIGARPEVSAAVPCAAMVLTLVALALMRTLQMRAFASIQLGHVLTAIVARAHHVFDALYERPYGGGAPPGPGPRAPTATAPTATVHWTGAAAVLQRIEVTALVRAAADHGGSVAFRVAPGVTLTRGTAIAEVTAGGAAEAALRTALGRTLVTGVERTFDQDPELPLRLLADIALRALSPAVNDPATAVEALDRVEDLLARLVGRELDVGGFRDDAGRLRVTVPVPDWERYVRTAVDDVGYAAAGSAMVLRRLRDLLLRLARYAPASRRAVLEERLRWVERAGGGAFPLVWTPPPDG